MANVNKPVPGADQYYPLNEPSVGVAYDAVGSATSDQILSLIVEYRRHTLKTRSCSRFLGL